MDRGLATASSLARRAHQTCHQVVWEAGDLHHELMGAEAAPGHHLSLRYRRYRALGAATKHLPRLRVSLRASAK